MSKTAAMSSTSVKSRPAASIFFMHELGDTPRGWSQLQGMLPSTQPRLSQLQYVFPPAPTIGITINGGMQMPGWFDLYDWPIAVGSKDDRDGKLAAVAQIEQEVVKLKQQGIDRDRIVVGGFSQGGAIALLSAYYSQNDKPFAGCVCLSGWLTLVDELKVSDKAKETPLFWGHGKVDDKVLFPQQAFGVDKLEKQGVQVDARDYMVGHGSHPDEMDAMASFVDKILFGEKESKE